MNSSLTDKPWERLGPGVAILDPVITHVKEGHSCWPLITFPGHAEGSKQVRQHTVFSQWSQQILDEMAPHQPACICEESVYIILVLYHVLHDKLST